MHRPLLALIGCAVAVGVLAPAARAKGPIELCGPGGCAFVTEEGGFARFSQAPVRPASVAPEPYYVLRFGDLGGALGYWLPSRGLLRWGAYPGAWRAPPPETAAMLVTAARGLEPHRAPRSADVVVGAKTVRRGAAFLQALYEGGARVASPVRGGNWLQVFVFGNAGSPWTDSWVDLWVSGRSALLRRDGLTYRVSADFAARLRDGRPLR